ncbi:MAG TPA: cytidine deaminase [Bacteroidales bacterium]|nr:cytidine deaminase [Bacteroidales bacterium]
MKIREISFSFKEYSGSELDNQDLNLINSAKAVAEKAYAPYSGFRVGAAVLLKSGTVVTGANVENAAFPTGICAERNALANAIVNYPGDQVITIAIAACTDDGFTKEFISPCGNCRQFIAEEEFRSASKIRIILSGEDKCIILDSAGSLLPLQFNKDNLRIALP